MNSESGKRLSMAELRDRNRPLPPSPPQMPDQYPTPEEWATLIERIEVLDYRTAEIYAALPRLRSLATQEQVEKLAAEVQALTAICQPAGKKKERRSWRPRFPQLSLRWLLVIPVLIGMAVALYGMLFGSAMIWNVFRTVFP